MKREILFRGVDIVTGMRVLGDLYHYDNCFSGVCINPISGIDRKTHKVHPESVGQYTGLKDKNGKKIFEGDVLKCNLSYKGGGLPHMGEVVYNNNLCCFCTKNLSGETPFLNHLIDTRETIGNVFQHPKLLEGASTPKGGENPELLEVE